MDITVVINQMCKLFLILCLGTILAKVNILDIHTKQKLTKMLLYVTTPMMMIDAFYDRMLMAKEQADSLKYSVGSLFLVSFAFYIILIFLSVIFIALLRPSRQDKKVYLFMTIFGNIGFMGFPVVQSVYGTEGLFYAAILNSMFNIFVYTFGVVLMSGNSLSNSNGSLMKTMRTLPWKKLLLTPAVLCTAVGVLIFVFRIPLPSIIAETCDTLGSLTSPLAMMVVGANLSGVRINTMFTDVKMILYVLVRQLAIPLVFWYIIHPFINDRILAPTLLLMVCMPVANTTALFATEYHGNEQLASKGIFLTTLFSLVSFPLMIWICIR
ncbi:MAG: AEC family transporter [Oscillospiraceae bacterium]|nr:AEC family transporter [Oscillospiraceae bacterium]